MRTNAASDSSLLVTLGEEMSRETTAAVLRLFGALQAQQDPRIRNLHPGYVSLLVDFDPLVTSQDEMGALVSSLAGEDFVEDISEARTVEIPVCYGGEFGPDLEDVAEHAGLTSEEVVRLHSGALYDVCFLGFTGGFAYLGGMPPELSMPRLATPRHRVEAGSVGIAGGQTGVYPTVTPGGWRLIGRTPLSMFDPKAAQPTLVLPGDSVRFVAIEREEFERLAARP